MPTRTVLILGTFDRDDPAKKALLDALLAAARAAGEVLNTRWITAKELALYPGLVTEADGVVLAPRRLPDPPVVDEDLLQTIDLARRFDRPFLATGESAVLTAVEIGRDVLGMRDAGLPLRDRKVHDPIAIALGDDPTTPDPPRRAAVRLEVARSEGPSGPEWTASRYGVNPDYLTALAEAGYEVSAREAPEGRPVGHALVGARFFQCVTFLPELGAGAEDPLITGFVAAVLEPRPDRGEDER